jgi:hypothetical protein
MTRRKALFVLGMHRSGTSALTGTLSLLGVNLGKSIKKPALDNQKGFYENTHVLKIDKSALRVMGYNPYDLFELKPGWWTDRRLTAHRRAIMELIGSDFRDDPIFAIKEPRICRLFPLWESVMDNLNIKYRFVIPIRDPMEVAMSLQKRNQLPLEKGALLWLDHVLKAEFYSRRQPRAIIHFNRLLAEPLRTMENVAKTLALDYPRKIADAKDDISRFLEPSLKHNNAGSKETGNAFPHISKCYRMLVDLAESPSNDHAIRDYFDELRTEFAGYLTANHLYSQPKKKRLRIRIREFFFPPSFKFG